MKNVSLFLLFIHSTEGAFRTLCFDPLFEVPGLALVLDIKYSPRIVMLLTKPQNGRKFTKDLFEAVEMAFHAKESTIHSFKVNI